MIWYTEVLLTKISLIFGNLILQFCLCFTWFVISTDWTHATDESSVDEICVCFKLKVLYIRWVFTLLQRIVVFTGENNISITMLHMLEQNKLKYR